MPDIKGGWDDNGSFSRKRLGAALALLVVVICALKLAYLERWLVDNDNYITLSTFFASAGHPNYAAGARRFYNASVASCDPQDKRCVAYSGAIHEEQTYARPLIAYFGSSLAQPKWLAGNIQFLDGITRATVSQVAASTALVIALLLCFLLSLPRVLSAFLAGMTALLGVTAFLLPEHAAFGNFQPLLGVGVPAAFAVLILALGAWLYARTAIRQSFAAETLSSERALYFLWAAALLVLAVRVAAHGSPTLYFGGQILGSRVGVLVLLFALAGVAVFLAAIAGAAAREGVPASAIWISVFLLFGFVSMGESFFITTFHIAPRGYIFLLAAPIMIYVALRPNGPAVWLLPALLLFHISVAGLLCGCILATELIAGLRRKSASLALLLSAAVLIVAGIHTVMTAKNPVVTLSTASLMAVITQLSVFSFLPGLVVGGVLLYAGYLAWRMPDPAGEFFLRATVLATLLAGAGQLREALEAAGYDLMDPVAYKFILLWYYLAPIVCAAGTFLVIFGFAASARSFAPSNFALSTRSLSLIAAGVLALVAARSGNNVGKPPNAFVAIAGGAQLMATQKAPAVDPRVVEAAAPNDRYLVGPYPGDAITMMSVLKMKARAAAGLLDPDSVSVEVIKRPSK